jgi:hypothetical protein
MASAFIVSGVTQDAFLKMQSKLVADGVAVDRNQTGGFDVEGHGVSALAYLSGTDLTVTIAKKPFYVTADHIKQGILDALHNN